MGELSKVKVDKLFWARRETEIADLFGAVYSQAFSIHSTVGGGFSEGKIACLGGTACLWGFRRSGFEIEFQRIIVDTIYMRAYYKTHAAHPLRASIPNPVGSVPSIMHTPTRPSPLCLHGSFVSTKNAKRPPGKKERGGGGIRLRPELSLWSS